MSKLTLIKSLFNLKKFIYLLVLSFLFLYSFSIPTFSNRFPYNYVTIALAGALVLTIFIYIFLYGKIKFDIFFVLLIFFNIICCFSSLTNLNLSLFPTTIILTSIVSLSLYQFLINIKRKNLICYIIFCSGILFAIIFFLYYKDELLNLDVDYGNRLGGFFDNQNEIAKIFGIFASSSLTIFVSNIYKFKKRWFISIFSLVFFFVFSFCIFTTGSISNLLTMFIVVIIFFYITFKTTKSRIFFSLVILIFAVAGILILQLPQFEYFKDRIYGIFFFWSKNYDPDSSFISRFQSAILSFKIGLFKPFFGYGYMSAHNYTLYNIQAHNNFAELFIDFGFFGFVFFELIMILPIFILLKNKKTNKSFAMLLYLFIFQMFLTIYYKKMEYVIFAYSYSLISDDFLNGYSFDINLIEKKCNSNNDITKCKKHYKIIELIPALSPVGGAETFVTNFILELKNKYSNDIDVVLILLYSNKETFLNDILNISNVKIIQLNKKGKISLSTCVTLRRIILDIKPDVIHSHLNSFITLFLSFPFGVGETQIFHTIHHNVPKKIKFNDKFLNLLIKIKFLKPICVSETPSLNYSKLVNRVVPFINNGINVDKFYNTHSFSERPIDFLCVGRFEKVKNQIFLLNVIEKYFKSSDFKFVFLGDGPLFDTCKNFCFNNNLENNVDFKGLVDNVEEYMAISKVLIMPSLNEGNPMVINEAYASGMVIVGNDVGGIHNLLSDKEYGFLCVLNDMDDFAKKIKEAYFYSLKRLVPQKSQMYNISIERCVDEYLNKFFKEK